MQPKDWKPGSPGILVTGDAWSQSRPDTINVIMSSPGDVLGNNVHRRRQGPIADVVRRAIKDTFVDVLPWLARRYPEAVVTVQPDYSNRGRYLYTVWSHPLEDIS